jgi:predicted RNase H-like nuclease (RuvC/YqgF family)
MDTAFIVALISLGAGVAGIITALATRRKSRADAAGVMTDAALKLIEPLNSRIVELEDYKAKSQKEHAEDRRTIERQEKEIEASNKRIAELERREIENRRKQEEDGATIKRQAKEITALYEKFKEYCIGAKALVGQLRRMGVTPDWTPPEK